MVILVEIRVKAEMDMIRGKRANLKSLLTTNPSFLALCLQILQVHSALCSYFACFSYTDHA